MLEMRKDNEKEKSEFRITNNLLKKQIEYLKNQYLLIIKES